MTNSLIGPEELPLPDTEVSLTARDPERIAVAIEAELAASTRRTYAVAWRLGALVPGERASTPLPGGGQGTPWSRMNRA